MMGGGDLGGNIFLNLCTLLLFQSHFSLSEPLVRLTSSWRAEFENPTSASLIAPVIHTHTHSMNYEKETYVVYQRVRGGGCVGGTQ